MAHNIRDLRCHLGVLYFTEIVGELRKMVDRFVEVIMPRSTTHLGIAA